MLKPFLKWAGGKNQILNKIREYYPNNLGREINKYCEPFVGGGAVLFDILNNYNLKEIYISDINKELINVYQTVKENINLLISELDKIQKDYFNLNPEQQKKYFYEQRNIFNKTELSDNIKIKIQKASLFIFLNKTCFNGLFRVNKKGEFNVPVGSYKNPLICDKDNLLKVSNALKNVYIFHEDFEKSFSFIDKNTFVYIDPPYRPLTKTSNFNAYNKTEFDDKEQIRLADFVKTIDMCNAKIVISNSDPKNSDKNDNFFEDLYYGFNINKIHARRIINSNTSERGNVNELLITNYRRDKLKYIDIYKKKGITGDSDAFNYLISTLKNTIRTYDFYVDWTKVITNVSKIEISLNILNTLLGKKNINREFKKLIKEYPEVVSVIPLIIAVRDKTIKITDIGKEIDYSFKKKNKYSEDEIDKIAYFCEKCGLFKILSDKKIKNLVDYCIGVEVGLDTNARKNRTGTIMENLIEVYVKSICDKYSYRYLTQATVDTIKNKFGREVPTDKSDRHFDFVIEAEDDIFLLEVNYYSVNGSKLKSVAGEFKSLSNLIKQQPNIGFIWITDGLGWVNSKAPLNEAFNEIDYILNIKMIEDGILEEIITKGL